MRRLAGFAEAMGELLLARWSWRAVPAISPPVEDSGSDLRRMAGLASRVHRAARVLRLTDACLPRAVALYHILQRRDISSRFCLGSRLVDGQLESHAWLEVDGVVVTGDLPDLATFQPFQQA